MLKYLLPSMGVAVAAMLFSSPASALTMKECSAKYQSAKDAGSLGDVKWNDFRKAQCGDDAEAVAPAKPAKQSTKKAAAAAAASEDDAQGLSMKECSAKYQAAKDADTLNGMKWNDFRKTQCSADAAAAPAQAKKAAKKADTTAASGDEATGLSMKECSAKYQAAKDAGTLGNTKWNDFRKTQCSADAAAAPEPVKQASTGDAKGLSMKECSAKYQNAKASGSLGSLKWNDFRKSECGTGASDDDDAPAVDEANYSTEPEVAVTAAPRGVAFPRAVARKFSAETPAKQRMHTCLESYYDNKDNNTLNGLRWIQKGGGFYSLCNQRLKAGS